MELFTLVQKVMQGDLTLRWYNANTEHVRVTSHDAARGLTYEVCNVGSYGYDRLPELIRTNYSMAPRGSELWGKLPDLGYAINRKSKELLSAETYAESSVGGNVMLGSFLLALYRHLAAVAPSPTAGRLFRLALQDTARLVAYGSGNLQYQLAHQPQHVTSLNEYLDTAEHCLLGLIGNQECVEPLIILSGSGTSREHTQLGGQRVARFLATTVAEYLVRCEHADLTGRSQRSRLPRYLQQLGIPGNVNVSPT